MLHLKPLHISSQLLAHGNSEQIRKAKRMAVKINTNEQKKIKRRIISKLQKTKDMTYLTCRTSLYEQLKTTTVGWHSGRRSASSFLFSILVSPNLPLVLIHSTSRSPTFPPIFIPQEPYLLMCTQNHPSPSPPFFLIFPLRPTPVLCDSPPTCRYQDLHTRTLH